MELTREWVAGATGGHITGPSVGGSPLVEAPASEGAGAGVCFDSRALEPGQVFVAIRDVRDGHDFVGDAHARGAAFSIVDRPVAGYSVVEVDDTRRALLALGAAARARIGAVVVGITGSVGKTSTKDLTAAALSAGFRTHAAASSFNNEIGVPVTLLGVPEDAEAVVVEMGARFPGNIAELCAIARPRIGVITNIGITHAEHLGGPEGVAAAKGELLDALPADGLAVICNDAVSAGQRARSAASVLTVGVTPDADVQVSGLSLDAELHPHFRLETPWGGGEVALAVRGAHQAVNAAQAATVALHLGVPMTAVIAALRRAESTGWRMQLEVNRRGVHVMNDSYNASPVATIAALSALGALPVAGRRIAVLGEMLELGEWSGREHARVGVAAAAHGIDIVIAVGDRMEPLVEAAAAAHIEVHRVHGRDAARALVLDLARSGDAVLVKASRAVGLEVVAHALLGAEVPA